MTAETATSPVAVPIKIARRRIPQASEPRKYRRLDFFLKIAESCNINCTYCYYYYGGDDSHLSNPKYIAADTVADLADFLVRTVRVSEVEELVINFHGGEPMMMQKWRFEEMCEALQKALGHIVRLSFGMQTNAMLVDDEWVRLIGKYDISMGLSLDGPAEYHDEFRVDHKGRGTYDRTLKGIQRLQRALAAGEIRQGFGLICVIDERRDGRRTLDHFVDVVGVKNIFFALPMQSHDGMDFSRIEGFTKYLSDVFDAWVERKDRSLRIRFIDHMFGLLMSGEEGLAARDRAKATTSLFTIASNGEIGCQDEERGLMPALFAQGVVANADVSLADFYALPIVDSYLNDKDAVPEGCSKCVWQRICDGGYELSGNAQRFSREKGFGNRSVYCESIQALLTKMVKYALGKGVPFSTIQKTLVEN